MLLPVRAMGVVCLGSARLCSALLGSSSRKPVCDRGGKMAAPPLSSRAGSAGSLGNSPTMAAGRLPHGGVGPELDFRSAARMEDLNRLIQEFSKHDQREYDDQRALEIHTAKDFIFSMLGETHTHTPWRGVFPPGLVSGEIRTWCVHGPLIQDRKMSSCCGKQSAV